MYSPHNSTAISHSALSLSSPTLLHAVFGMKNPLLIDTEFVMPIRLDGCLILVVVLTSYCFFCVCWFIICWKIRKEICLHRSTLLCSQLADCWVKCGAIEHCVAPVLCRFLGHQQTWKGKGRELEPGPGVSGRREESRIGGSSEAPSPDPRSRAGIKVACFMWLVRDFEVLESPTALTSSSSLVS